MSLVSRCPRHSRVRPASFLSTTGDLLVARHHQRSGPSRHASTTHCEQQLFTSLAVPLASYQHCLRQRLIFFRNDSVRHFGHNCRRYLQRSRPQPTFDFLFTTNQPGLSLVASLDLLKDRSGEYASTLNTSRCSYDLQPLLDGPTSELVSHCWRLPITPWCDPFHNVPDLEAFFMLIATVAFRT